MNSLLLGLNLVIEMAIIAVAVDIAKSLRDVRKSAYRLEWSRPFSFSLRPDVRPEYCGRPAGCALWAFNSGTWELETTECPRGYEPGPAPKFRGRFEGERIWQECVPSATK